MSVVTLAAEVGAGMDDEAAILDVIERDLLAYLGKDEAALAALYVREDRLVSIMQIASAGLIRSWCFDAFMNVMREAWDAQAAPSRSDFSRSDVSITVKGDMAWAFFNQNILNSQDPTDPPAFSHNVRVFEREHDGWKIVFHGVFEPAAEAITSPRIDVDGAARVLSMNAQAKTRIADFPGLSISNGILRAARPSWDKDLHETIARAAELSVYSVLHKEIGRSASPEFPVVLGEDDEGALLICLVRITDFAVSVTFDDVDALARRLNMARVIYGLSPAQSRLAQEIADGHDLAEASANMGITINTARTHLRRMFDKTGTHSQTGLLRMILSLG